ncbi:MAG TPA: putative glycoside hydrolase [Candidatus Paceibacterota bacterium]|nr:putative glycoside hydrolase [Candidatus Paceibacterota bacterium]
MINYIGISIISLLTVVALLSHASIPRSDLAYQKPSEAVSVMDANEAETKPELVVAPKPAVTHVPLPPQVKAIYMTSCVAGTPNFRERLLKLVSETEINSIVLDIKDYSGTISFLPDSEAWLPAWQNARCGARDMRELISLMHEQNIFVIGRITVFQDPFEAERRPHLAVKKLDGQTNWKDGKGLSFIDVAAREYWDHIVDLAVDSYNIGFDELNFDYVRYPSDGNMRDISFPHSAGSNWPNDKQANLEAFFAYLKEKMDDESLFADFDHQNTGRASSTPWTSADLFGMTTTNFDDLSIGQVQERAAPYFDFIAPMVYPSHYPPNYLGLGNPNLVPYKIVHHAMSAGVERMKASTTRMQGFLHERIGTSTPAVYQKPVFGADRLRTWIQDFDYGGNYDVAEVRAQIQASYDAGVMSWMIWAPSNIYTKGALRPPLTYEVPE